MDMSFKAVHRWIRRIWVTLGIAATLFLIWNVQAHGVPAAMYQSDARVRVAAATYGRTFIPVSPLPDVPALIFLPGGMVDPDAYVPLVRAVAEAGSPAAIVELPWRSAMTDGMRATLWERIRSARMELGQGRPVALAGHSRGGMFAANFAADHPSEIGGLILIGTTHPRDRNLSGATSPVLWILGSQDCVASIRDARANAHNLPAATRVVEIAGANHRQFGYYGWQLGDCSATISREEQHRQTVDAIVGFLGSPRS